MVLLTRERGSEIKQNKAFVLFTWFSDSTKHGLVFPIGGLLKNSLFGWKGLRIINKIVIPYIP